MHVVSCPVSVKSPYGIVWLKVRVALPRFSTVTSWAALVEPTFVLGKESEGGSTMSIFVIATETESAT